MARRAVVPVLLLPLVIAACGGSKPPTRTLTVPSSSMEPTLHCARPGPGCEANVADEVIVEEGSSLGRGDIVAFTAPHKAELVCGSGGTFVKRLIGLPGEKIVERNGFFYVNGTKLDEPYMASGRRDHDSSTWNVPKNSYFIVGDNRAQSCDSREFGSVAKEAIQGKVVAIQRPSGRIQLP